MQKTKTAWLDIKGIVELAIVDYKLKTCTHRHHLHQHHNIYNTHDKIK